MQDIQLSLDTACLAATLILQFGGETYRSEETAGKICEGLGFRTCDVLALPTGIIITAVDESGVAHTRIGRVKNRMTNLSAIDECNKISRDLFCGTLSAEEAYRSLLLIKNRKDTHIVTLILACLLSCGFFTLMLGGDWPDFGVSCFCGLLIQLLLPLFSRIHIPSMIGALLTSALSTAVALSAELYIQPLHIEAIISGAIMPVLPGLALTNAIRDMIRGDMVSGGARMMEAVLCALMIAAGVGLVFVFWGGCIIS